MTRGNRVRRSSVPIPLVFAVCALAGLSLLSPTRLAAQSAPPDWDNAPPSDQGLDWTDQVPAHVSFAEGEAWLERENTIDGAPTGVPLLAGDRLRAERGRLEVLFADGSVLSLDEHTDLDLLADDLLRLNRGTLRLDLTREAGSAGYRVDAAGTTTWLRAAGEYRLETVATSGGSADVRLHVVRGHAELTANGRSTLLRTGYEAFASATTTPSLPYAVTVTRWDGFDRWWDDRRALRGGHYSARYLPSEVTYYGGVLDRDGDWRYEQSYGYVWYPRVASTWHPYSAGRWAFLGTYGWVWIGVDAWAWPTHHYGRWGHTSGRYFWIPGRAWAPAWVAWASSPTYVGWAPLGFDNRPLFSISVAYTSGWRAWNYAPARSFSAGIVFAGRGQHVPSRDLVFSTRYTAPVTPARVTSRAAALRGPGQVQRTGTVAVPRVAPRQLPAAGGALGSTRQPVPGDRLATSPQTAPRRAPGIDRAAPARNLPSVRSAPADDRTPAPRTAAPSSRVAPSSRTVIQPTAPRRQAPEATPDASRARPRAGAGLPAPRAPAALDHPAVAGPVEPGALPRRRPSPPNSATSPALEPAPRPGPSRSPGIVDRRSLPSVAAAPDRGRSAPARPAAEPPSVRSSAAEGGEAPAGSGRRAVPRPR